MSWQQETVSSQRQVLRCKLHWRKLDSSAQPAAVTQLVAAKNNPSILGANPADCKANRFSVWAAEPVEVFEFAAGSGNPFERLEKALDSYKLDDTFADDLPTGIFTCGWIGFFSYELGRFIEKLPAKATDDLHLPLIRLCFYDRAIVYDRSEEKWWLLAIEIAGQAESAGEKLLQVSRWLVESENVTPPSFTEAAELQGPGFEGFSSNITRQEYFSAIERIRQYIYDGDVYQVNFSQRFEAGFCGDGVDLYHWQNHYNPSPYAAYIDAGDFIIVSTSPEMFLTVRDGVISTKPIKGTRPRVTSVPMAEQVNQANFSFLVESEKEQAELNMIIDLERNDLTRVCRFGTVRLSQSRMIEAYPTVFHAVAVIEGELRDWRTADWFSDVLRATFPGGSITGAPKIRAMEIIDELEPTQRAVYTGSIGFIGLDGSVCLNIAIRTVIIKTGRAYIQTGGGIVADSDPQAEWDETLIKAKALLAGVSAVGGCSKKRK